uniref:Uncharacterized protein n=1 Tax=Timema cristinae TaxID=61476 RepID=A0A7R9H8Z3_TIMCR|nr:unnamed protein product [Timema cristinae]
MGLLLYELSCTLIEKRRRNLELQSDEENNNCFVDNVHKTKHSTSCECVFDKRALAQEALRCLQKTEEIFFGDVYEPPGLKKRLRALQNFFRFVGLKQRATSAVFTHQSYSVANHT